MAKPNSQCADDIGTYCTVVPPGPLKEQSKEDLRINPIVFLVSRLWPKLWILADFK